MSYRWRPRPQSTRVTETPCCRAASVLPPWNSRCKIELIFGVRLQFNVVWCIHSRREIVLTIQSDNGKQGYKVGGKKYRRPKVVLSQRPLRTVLQRLDSETRGILSSQRDRDPSGKLWVLTVCSVVDMQTVQRNSGNYRVVPRTLLEVSLVVHMLGCDISIRWCLFAPQNFLRPPPAVETDSKAKIWQRSVALQSLWLGKTPGDRMS